MLTHRRVTQEEPSSPTPCVSLIPADEGLRTTLLIHESLNLATCELVLWSPAACGELFASVWFTESTVWGKRPCHTCSYINGLRDCREKVTGKVFVLRGAADGTKCHRFLHTRRQRSRSSDSFMLLHLRLKRSVCLVTRHFFCLDNIL